MSVRRTFLRTRTVVICDERKDIFQVSTFANLGFNVSCSNLLSQNNPSNGWLYRFVQEEPVAVQLYPIFSILDWVVVVSTFVGILSLECENSGELPTNVLARTLILRCMFLLPYQEVWKSCPSMLPFEQLMRLVR